MFEILFGGSRGGGKTDGMLGDFVTHAGKYGEDAIGLCVRRERTQLKEMIERSRQIYGPLGAKFSSQEKQWRFPNGARLTFAYLENDADAEAYQGWNTCVALGTRIKMADGSLKTIESISRGEMVLTLEGPKKVLDVVSPYRATCVRALVRDGSGAVVGAQTHPVWHPVLTSSGLTLFRNEEGVTPAWVSWDAGARQNTSIALHNPSSIPPPPAAWMHPYTGEEHRLTECVSVGEMDLDLCGESWVSDLCVEDANHYISECGLINKNTRVYVEEMGNFPRPEPIFKLMATLRSGNPDVKVGFRATANPGGPGHLWIRARYIDPAPFGLKVLTEKFMNPFTKHESSIERVYIPSKVTDNKFCNNDEYIARLQLAAGAKLLQAWLHGDWNLIEGAFFSEWDESKHIIQPFAIPTNWTRFMSADWGSAAPFSIGWWAVVSDDYDNGFGPMSYSDGGAAYKGGLPRGAIIRYREWYGSPNHNNVGLKMFAEEVAAGIVERESEEPRNQSGGAHIAYRVIDPDACREKGGPSISERMSWAPNRLFWRPADNARVGRRGAMGGWDSVRARLKGENGVPMLYVFSNCTDLIRCLPVAQHDPDNMEDIDDCEDHCFDGDTLVSTPGGPVRLSELSESGVVNTPVGPRDYHGARVRRRNVEKVRLSFSDDSTVVCTPDHEFLTDSGWVKAADLTCCKALMDISQCKLQSYQKQSKNSAELDTTTAGNTSKARGGGSMFSRLLRRLLSGTQAKMDMNGIRAIIESAWLQSFTRSWRKYVAGAEALFVGKNALCFAQTAASQRNEGRLASTTFPEHAPCADASSRQTSTANRRHALQSAGFPRPPLKELKCTGLEPCGRGDVYCITVPETGCFLLADGKIVANCIDDLRYACMSRPYVSSSDAKKLDRMLTIGEGNKVTLNDILDQYDHKSPKSYERIR